MEAIHNNSVVVIWGATGSGKFEFPPCDQPQHCRPCDWDRHELPGVPEGEVLLGPTEGAVTQEEQVFDPSKLPATYNTVQEEPLPRDEPCGFVDLLHRPRFEGRLASLERWSIFVHVIIIGRRYSNAQDSPIGLQILGGATNQRSRRVQTYRGSAMSYLEFPRERFFLDGIVGRWQLRWVENLLFLG
jgi:hypothetical protein